MEETEEQKHTEQAGTPPAEAPEPLRDMVGPRGGGEQNSLEDIVRQAGLMEDKEALRGDYGPRSVHYHINNYVHNSGTIQGDLSQSHSETAAKGEEPSQPFAGTEEDIRFFFQSEHEVKELAAVLAAAELGSIPESRFFQIAERLEEALRQTGGPADENRPEAAFKLRSIDELADPFPVSREHALVSYGPEAQEVRCLRFGEGGLDGKVRTFLWENYAQLRPIIVGWLVERCQDKGGVLERMIADRAVAALSEHAAMDIGYAFRDMLPALEKCGSSQHDIRYLTAWVESLMERESCRSSVDELLCRWCRREGVLWQVPYRLFGRAEGWRFQEEVRQALSKQMAEDIAGAQRSYLTWYRYNRGYLLSPAHGDGSSVVAALLIRQVAEQFEISRDYAQRYRVAVYFLSLFRWDYLTDFSEQPELIFLQGFYNKELRSGLLPLVQFAWRRPELRDAMGNILALHFAEIDRCGASWSYLTKPFQFLAFTGKEYDYKITFACLEKCARAAGAEPVARALEHDLAEVVRSRNQRYTSGRTDAV